MELDVKLERIGDEAWGFRLIGGSEFKMPLTVVKVLPESPAERAGLQNGDTVSRINGVVADNLAHDDARHTVAVAGDTLMLGVVRGLYDPVLDDYEPIYEPIDQEDFDQPSQLSEVFSIQQFPDIVPNVIISAPDLPDRSQTVSPFLLPTKPYRPFSTDPIPVPSLESPIILNPNYRDDFGQVEDESLPPTNFKLPVSPQYDPDGTKKKRGEELKKEKSELIEVSEDSKVTTETCEVNKFTQVNKKEIQEDVTEKFKDVRMTDEEIKFNEQMRKEIDLDRIEYEATNIVDKSIQKAVTVSEDIKHEIEIALTESSVKEIKATEEKSIESVREDIKNETKTKSSAVVEESSVQKERLEVKKDVKDLVNLIDKTTEEIIKQNGHNKEVNVAKEVEMFETIKDRTMERKAVAQEEIQEVIEAGSVKRKSIIFDKDVEEMKEIRDVTKVESVAANAKQEEKQIKENMTKASADKTKSEMKSDTKYSTTKLLKEQRAYTIGLQTIPNIRGTVHSSYHYDLLLKTFFIHLTDVMVALSRFILAEPVLSREKQEVQTETVTVKEDLFDHEINESVESKEIEKIKQEEVKREVEVKDSIPDKMVQKVERVKKEVVAKVKGVEAKALEQEVIKHYVEESPVVEEKRKSGAKMAQLTEKKSEELTQKMEAVISEFQAKTGIEETQTLTVRDRPKSRSVIEEEVAKESDPLEWLSKVDSQKSTKTSEQITEVTAETALESIEAKKLESRYESKKSKSKEGRNTYIAIVESHVYTNKDAILEEQLSPISETSSVQSIQEISTAIVAKEATATVDNSEVKKEMIKVEQAQEAVQAKQETAVKLTKKADSKVSIEKVQEVQQSVAVETTGISQELKETAVETIVEVLEPIIEKEVKIKDSVTFNTALQAEGEIVSNKEVIEEKKETTTAESAVEIKEVIEVEDKKAEIKDAQSLIKESVASATSVAMAVAVATKTAKDEVKIEEIKISDENKSSSKQESIMAIRDVVEEVKQIDVKEKETQKFDVNIDQDIKKAAMQEKLEIMQPILAINEEKKELESIIKQSSVAKSSVIVEVAKKEAVDIQEKAETVKEQSIVAVEEPKSTVKDESAALKIIKQDVKEKQAELELINETKIQEITEVIQEAKVDNSIIELKKEEIQESIIDVKKSEAILENLVALNENSVDVGVSVVAKRKESKSEFHEIKSGSRKSLQVERMQSLPDDEEVKKTKEEVEINSQKKVEISEETTITNGTVQEKKLTLRLDLVPEKMEGQLSTSSSGDISTPTPSTYPPTPLTDEYIFRLEIPLPRNRDGTPYPRDPSPEPKHDEDPHIVKKNLVPHIETTIEKVVYDPPLPTPPERKEPVYQKPGLKGGAINFIRKEEIKEIERKSSLLASAIDKTIKSIEEYKEQVGIDNKYVQPTKTVSPQAGPVMYNGYSEVVETKVTKDEEQWSKVDKQVKKNNENILQLAKAIAQEARAMRKQQKSKAAPKDMPECLRVKGGETGDDLDVKNVEVTGFRPVEFKPEEIQRHEFMPVINVEDQSNNQSINQTLQSKSPVPVIIPETGEVLGTIQGIVDGLEDATVDEEIAKELGKPGITEEKIAELISGESEMLREAHVMGLSRVLASHMHRLDDDNSSVDFKKIKPIIESMKDSEVLKALNEEIVKTKEEKRKEEERKWTTFLQRPNRPVPSAKFGYYGYIAPEEKSESPYKVKIVKQPKPKVAPDYKTEDFDTGPLPWEARAVYELSAPIEPEDPILVPEEVPEILEAVDPLPESEVPDLEDTGIPLPPEKPKEEIKELALFDPEEREEEPIELDIEAVVEETVKIVEEMTQSNLADQLVSSVQSMVDPNAPVEQQLAQMRQQLAALAQLPSVIQQTLQVVTERLSQISQKDISEVDIKQESAESVTKISQSQKSKVIETKTSTIIEEVEEETEQIADNKIDGQSKTEEEAQRKSEATAENVEEEQRKQSLSPEEMEKMRKEEEAMLEEQRKIEKQKKELMEQAQLEHESRQVKQHPTPRVGKPKPMFGPLTPQERPVVLPGGRKWRKPKDAYNEQFISEILSSQAEIIMGKAKGTSYESVLLPYDERINFMKYEKPPVSLDHLQNSDVYKLIHNMEKSPMKRVEMLTPVVAECDYREKCRSITPCTERMAKEEHLDYPQQVQP